MSWFRTKPTPPPVPLPAATFSPPPLDPILKGGIFDPGAKFSLPMPIPESMEDIVRRVVREELDRRFGPTGE